MIVSVRTAITANTFATTGAFLLSIASMAPVIMLNAAGILPGYIAVPLCFLVLAAALYVFWSIAATRWFIWAFRHVNDVCELKKTINGFNAYAPEKLQKNHPEAFREIMARFESYEFTDDNEVPPETVIYNRRIHQSWAFASTSAITISICLYSFHYGDFEPALLLLFVLVIGIAVYEYYKTADRSPQITLNDKGIWHIDDFIDWHEVKDYQIIGGETSYLEVIMSEQKRNIFLDYLNINKLYLNHLLHVYRQRHLKAHSPAKP